MEFHKYRLHCGMQKRWKARKWPAVGLSFKQRRIEMTCWIFRNRLTGVGLNGFKEICLWQKSNQSSYFGWKWSWITDISGKMVQCIHPLNSTFISVFFYQFRQINMRIECEHNFFYKISVCYQNIYPFWMRKLFWVQIWFI